MSYAYLGKFPALNAIDMTIQQGEKIAIIGANGCGKSTLLQLLDGLIFPDQGMVSAFGTVLSEQAFRDQEFSQEFRRSVGLVFQNPDIQLFCPTVKDDIVFGPLQLGMRKPEIIENMDRLVMLLGIAHLLERVPYQLSIGEKRKVAIASTLICNPEVLLLDEPTAGLDPLTTHHIIDILASENQHGKTIITTTHDLHIVPEIAERVIVMNNQKQIAATGSAHTILTNQALLERHNLIRSPGYADTRD